MDDRRFDSLTRALAAGQNRRSLLKGLLGIGGVAATGAALGGSDAEAARRPTPPPKPVTCQAPKVRSGDQCVCPGGFTTCGSECCPNGQAECCDGACCYGDCYGEELCCPIGSVVCDGACIDPALGQCCSDLDCADMDDPSICLVGRCWEGVCEEGYGCAGLEQPRCCFDGTCADMAIGGNCCKDSECPSGSCNLEIHICR